MLIILCMRDFLRLWLGREETGERREAEIKSWYLILVQELGGLDMDVVGKGE